MAKISVSNDPAHTNAESLDTNLSGSSFWKAQALVKTALGVLIVAAVIMAVVTIYGMWDGLSPSKDLSLIIRILWIDLAILGVITILVLSRVASAWLNIGRKGGSKLLARVTLLFSAVAIVPTILVILFSIATFNIGVQAWFSKPVSTAINESQNVADAYLKEHKQTLVIAALEIATEINRVSDRLADKPDLFSQMLDEMSLLYEVNEAVALNGKGEIFAIGGLSPLIAAFKPVVSEQNFAQASSGTVILIDAGDQRSIDALLLLQGFEDRYLYITRFVDSKVVESVVRSENAASTYNSLELGKNQFQYAFILIFAVVGLLLLLGALGFGMMFANTLTRPIARLTEVANRLGEGDLSARVDSKALKIHEQADDEISNLTSTFNTMATRLDSQQTALKKANTQLDERRKFTQAVLSGVSAGVVGLSSDGEINLPNEAASTLLNMDLTKCIGKKFGDVVPELARFTSQALESLQNQGGNSNQVEFEEVSLKVKGELRTLRLVFVSERGSTKDKRYILTFDDITELQRAQRTAAWSDVARRIAHEIKNPLTPIQLSAERLKRRFSKQIDDGRDTFELCTETIIRQVNDIGRMVDEFANFARTPTPVLGNHDLREICEQAVFLQNNRDATINFEAILPSHPVKHEIDASLISQSILNILKNAGEAVITRREKDAVFAESKEKGQVRLTLLLEDENGNATKPRIYVQDNGCGIPLGMKSKLTEPYVTTRTKGTGLGLAIVKKIFEDHGGALLVDEGLPTQLIDPKYSGAHFCLML